jgi:ribosome-binding factor A
MSNRIEKVNALIKSLIGEILTRELSLKPGIFLTVAKVDTSKDLRYTRIFLSIFPEKEITYVEKTLVKEIYKIQGIMNKKLSLKPLPKIQFKTDMTESKADEIEKLLKQI